MIQVVLRFPVTVSEKNIRLMCILPKLQMQAAFKIPDTGFTRLKQCAKGVDFVFAKAHLNDANNHPKKILMVL